MKLKKSLLSTLLLSTLILSGTQTINVQAVASQDPSTGDTPTTNTNDSKTIIDSGAFTERDSYVTWDLYSDGTLDIKGGVIKASYDSESPFWPKSTTDKPITKIIITGKLTIDNGNGDASNLFANQKGVTSIEGLNNLDTSNVTNFANMFYGDKKLTTLDLSSFDTSKAENLADMFMNCSSLTSLDLSNFNTSNVSSMVLMFSGDTALKVLNISNFDTTLSDSTGGTIAMFADCSNLTNITVGEKTILNKRTLVDTGLDSTKSWVDIGKGTATNPQPENKAIETADLFSGSHPGNYVSGFDEEYTGPDTVKVTSNLFPDGEDVTVPDNIKPKYVNASFDLSVAKDGYTAEPDTVNVKAVKAADGTQSLVLTNPGTVVQYTKKSTPSHDSGGSHTTTPVIKSDTTDSIQYVTTHNNIDKATLYDDQGKELDNLALAKNTDWYSNEVLTLNGEKYYQVATDQWVKADYVYVYQPTDKTLQTKNVNITYLKNINDKQISNRGLAKLTDWRTDQIVQIDGQTYYRVATNEFVNADDVNFI